MNKNIIIENTRILFPNFSGIEREFNPAGRRNFNVVLPHDVAEQMGADGFNVRYLKPRDDGEEPTPILKVNVSFDRTPPKILMINSFNQVYLNSDTVSILDTADIINVDLVIRPYNYGAKLGRPGMSAYLQSLYVTIQDDPFEAKYTRREEIPF